MNSQQHKEILINYFDLSKQSCRWILLSTCLGLSLLTWGIFSHSPSIDEVGHFGAGLSHWELGCFELYAVNPPFVRLLATTPALALGAQSDYSGMVRAPEKRFEFEAGKRAIALTSNSVALMIPLGRLLLLPFIMVGAFFTLRCAQRLGSATVPPERTILWLWYLNPLLLGHGDLITPDTAAAAALIAVVASIQNWSIDFSWTSGTLVAVAVTFMMCIKFTGLPLIPIIMLAAILLFHRESSNSKPWIFVWLQLIYIAVIVCYGVNAVYGFSDTFHKLGTISFVSDSLADKPVPGVREDAGLEPNRFSNSCFASIPVPVPKCYLQGIDIQKCDFERGFRSYLMGEWKHGGWWYYYLVGFLVKEPIGFQLMLYVSILHGLCNWKRWTKESLREWSLIVLPPLLIFGLVSSQTGFNHHMRYVLPAYPFLFIIAARTVTLGKFWKWFSFGCLTWQAASVLWFAPHWMSYFNEFAGGPRHGHDWLVDSNIDWGQDILGLKWWQDKHPDIDLQAALFTGFDPKDIGLKYRLPAPYIAGQPDVVSKEGLRGPQPGWYAISVCQLKGHHFNVPAGNGNWEWSAGHFTYFMDHFEPVDMIGYSIYIYHITEEDAAAVREKLATEEVRLLVTESVGLKEPDERSETDAE